MIYVIEKMSEAKLSVVKDGNIESENTQFHIGLTSLVKEQGLLDDSVKKSSSQRVSHFLHLIKNLAIIANSSLGISHGISSRKHTSR
jgi:hypothetical protein